MSKLFHLVMGIIGFGLVVWGLVDVGRGEASGLLPVVAGGVAAVIASARLRGRQEEHLPTEKSQALYSLFFCTIGGFFLVGGVVGDYGVGARLLVLVPGVLCTGWGIVIATHLVLAARRS